MQVIELTKDHHDWARELLASHMGSPAVALRGRLYDPLAHPGFVALAKGLKRGLLTYVPGDSWWEILTLHATSQWQGTGSALIEAMAAAARRKGIRWLRVTTTNDNVDALRFYQKRQFRLVDLRTGAVDRSRALKPEIPSTGAYGIPIRDELELERELA
ncbi:MAG TPA: GNAT family N-acetyltransferase [Actinomycetota bacterium]|nr:GNAT family N-acetyltransferase [Actinomycetota bacterium]